MRDTVGEDQDHAVYEIDGELIVRYVKNPDPAVRASAVRTESRVLEIAKTVAPPAVPVPLLAVPSDGVMVYDKIPGVPLLHLRANQPHLDVRFGAVLGSFLRRLHRVPLAALDGAVPVEREPLASWLSQARREYVEVRDAVPAERRAPIEIFLSSPPPPDPTITALCHNDLGTEHILVDPGTGTITGIIDWGDAAITDPAYDLALILRDLGADVLRTVLDAYDDSYDAGEDAQPLRQRAEFYARCSVFEDLTYALDPRLCPGHDAYREQSLSALPRLFPGARTGEHPTPNIG